jgi:succinyl-CoA synthetase beta subunit
MNIHEFQAKQLLSRFGVPASPGMVSVTPDEARAAAQVLLAGGAPRLAVKAQIHAGGRGKGTFQSGYAGGVTLCTTADEAMAAAGAMLGQVLVTRQTGPAGRTVSRVLVEAAPTIRKEFYLAVLLDRAAGRPLLMASAEGGMNIEEVAARSPDRMIRQSIDPAFGLMAYQARQVASALGWTGPLMHSGAKLLQGVYRTWWECDASLVEINPLALVESGGTESLLAIDAKISLDDNALYRHADIQAMRDLAEEAPLEIEAGKHHLSYIQLDGTIACLVNGAGLAMATMDIIQHHGGQPANFLDVGGGASQEQVTAAFQIILHAPNVQAILVNIFGGIMDCNVIATGIVTAVKETGLTLPLVVRLEGNNVDRGNRTLDESGLSIIRGTSMADAAERVVQAARGH